MNHQPTSNRGTDLTNQPDQLQRRTAATCETARKRYTNSDKFQTQTRQRCQPPKHTTGKMAGTHDELNNPTAHQASDEDTCEGEQYALDSGAHPSHVSKLTPNMKPLWKIIRTNTATNITPPATHKGMIPIPTSTNRHIRIPTIANPAMRSNLLLVHDIAEQWAEVRFTPTQAFVLDTSTHPPQIVPRARFRRGMYYQELPTPTRKRQKHGSPDHTNTANKKPKAHRIKPKTLQTKNTKRTAPSKPGQALARGHAAPRVEIPLH